MPTVFLSYSREDLSLIEQLEAQLKNHPETAIWRDQDKIYGGEKWPKLLGEAIAHRDVFLLAWSKHSSASHFVEFEWCTALALKKKIVPCLLDNTILPPSLASINSISVDDLPKIVAALTGVGLAEDRGRRVEVISKLGQIKASEPEDVLAETRPFFDQRSWMVHGNVIQGENVTVQIKQRSEQSAKGFAEKWQTWVAIVVGLLTAVTLAIGLIGKISGISTDGGPFIQTLDGHIFDECTKQPVSGVLILLSTFKLTQQTDDSGSFHFEMKTNKQEQVTFTAQKQGYDRYTGFANVGLTPISINLQRKCR